MTIEIDWIVFEMHCVVVKVSPIKKGLRAPDGHDQQDTIENFSTASVSTSTRSR
jgi:hypothetical protein